MESQRHRLGQSKPVVGAYVRIDDDCPIDHRVLGTDAEFTCGYGIDVFEFVIAEQALREFVRQGGAALDEIARARGAELNDSDGARAPR